MLPAHPVRRQEGAPSSSDVPPLPPLTTNGLLFHFMISRSPGGIHVSASWRAKRSRLPDHLMPAAALPDALPVISCGPFPSLQVPTPDTITGSEKRKKTLARVDSTGLTGSVGSGRLKEESLCSQVVNQRHRAVRVRQPWQRDVSPFCRCEEPMHRSHSNSAPAKVRLTPGCGRAGREEPRPFTGGQRLAGSALRDSSIPRNPWRSKSTRAL